MTRDDILEAAFHAWGRDAYRTMNLSAVASRLNVTKPALYRHFRNKEALQDAMTADFFDRFSVRLRTILAEAAKPAPENERLLNVVEGLADYFARNREDLIFIFARLLGMPETEKLFFREFQARGVTPPVLSDSDERKPRLHFTLATCFFSVAIFHLDRGETDMPPTEPEIARAIADARSFVAHGLAFPLVGVTAIEYSKLDGIAGLTAAETSPGDGLLPSIAAAVAEAGPWNASMELIARKSGLSKSGLYAHFKSREEMLRQLFITEFERISNLMRDRAALSALPAERLYLALAAAEEYLLARQDVLVALDWVRAQRIDMSTTIPETLMPLFGFLSDAAARGECRIPTDRLDLTVQWILFLLVNMLMARRQHGLSAGAARSHLHVLHSLVCIGIEGW